MVNDDLDQMRSKHNQRQTETRMKSMWSSGVFKVNGYGLEKILKSIAALGVTPYVNDSLVFI